MINTLRALITERSPDMVLTAAPQCPLLNAADVQMKDILEGAQLDKIWIQFYNNEVCDATTTTSFNYASWETYLKTTINSGAELFVGLPATPGVSGYITPAAAKSLICTYRSYPMFKGIMLWDAETAAVNIHGGKNYYESIHSALNGCWYVFYVLLCPFLSRYSYFACTTHIQMVFKPLSA
jgi:chitinase